MNKKQFCFFLAVALFGGLIGGFLSGKVFTDNTAFAQSDKKPKIIEANEFRVVDDNGNVFATFGMKTESWSKKKYEFAELHLIGKTGELKLVGKHINVIGKSADTMIDASGLHTTKKDDKPRRLYKGY